MTLPTPDMSTWSILDFELAYDGLRQVNEASLWLQNQPRAEASGRSYHPGAEFIVALGEDWCGSAIDGIVNRLAAIRFDDAGDEDRRLRLLLNYYTQWGPGGEPLPAILAMLDKWRAPLAA